MLNSNLKVKTNPLAKKEQMVFFNNTRITVLTDNLFRIETQQDRIFEDGATQAFWFRDLPVVSYEVKENKDFLFIKTSEVVLRISKKTEKPLDVKFLKENIVSKCNNSNNLKSTKRTLDMSFGKEILDDGIMSLDGVSVVDDSKSLIVKDDGKIVKREHQERDIYVFAYYKNYRKCLSDFYKISGNVPLIPRFALGVWWSRYRAYTQDEYKQLMIAFMEHDVPLSVATIDMDWHWVDIKELLKDKYDQSLLKRRVDLFFQDGWTGYSWNTNLFPNYKELLSWLQANDLKVTLNIHPADGVRHFENQYVEFAERMGIDPESLEPICFSLAKDDYINNYFDLLHHPYENEGVDFWWIDWLQGKNSDVEGLDPLWALNHYHYIDNKNHLILSRYAGVGSHRYPLGFSGDTHINWEVLKFQPYFTVNANNIGYSWWSHDIGGHYCGHRDDELYVRWIQFGVFSPIIRLHSTSNDLLGKEPWRYPLPICNIASDWLRLRHKLVPYIYSLNYENHLNDIALCEAMYFTYPDKEEAYEVKNQYMFGSLLVAPITKHTSKALNMAYEKVWLPEGKWTDIFTNNTYNGNQFVYMFRDLASIPVLAKEGSIIPLSLNKGNGVANPKELEILLYNGNGTFTMYEDNEKDLLAKTNFKLEANETISFKFKVEGDTSFLPQTRNYKLSFKNVANCSKYEIIIDGKVNVVEQTFEPLSTKTLVIELKDININSEVTVNLIEYNNKKELHYVDHIVDIMGKWQKDNTYKSIRYDLIKHNFKDYSKCYHAIKSLKINKDVRRALLEVFDINKVK